MQTYNVHLTGKTPLLMHWDNIDYAEQITRFRKDPANKKTNVKGDDRSPAHSWLGYLYNNGSRVVVPSDNLMRAFMEAGGAVEVPGAKHGKTFKAQTQSGMMVNEESWDVLVGGKPIDVASILALENERDFAKHQTAVVEHGFSLFVKRAKVGMSKHVRVRPRFDRWEIKGTINVWDEQITKDVLSQILDVAGNYKGLGDWRPSSRTPGPYGRFAFEIR